MNTKMIENAKEVRDIVFLTLQEHDDWVTSTTIANELGLGREQVKTALTKLKTEHPEIISSRSFGYKITASKKNSEGCSDPTASTAINAICDSQSVDKDRDYNTSYYGACYDNILPGTLWETASSKGDSEYFFVVVDLVNGAPMAFGIPMYPDSYGQIDLTVSSILHGDFYGSMSQIRCKPMKYFKSELTIKCSSEALDDAKTLIANLIGADKVIQAEHKAGYNEGYFKGFDEGKNASEEEHKECLAEEHQRGLREGTDRGYNRGYLDGKKDGFAEAMKETRVSDTKLNPVENVVERVAEPVKIAPIAVENITVDGVTYTKDDLISLITERDMYQMFYKDIFSFNKGGRP